MYLEPNPTAWSLVFLLMLFLMMCLIVIGASDANKNRDKHKRRKRLDKRKKEMLTASIKGQARHLEDYEAFEKMIGRYDPEATLPIFPEKFRVSVTQLYCTNDLAQGEKTVKTEIGSFYDQSYDPKYYHYPGMYIDCQI